MQVAPEHAKAIGKGSGIRMEEGLFLNGVALHSGGVSPRGIESAFAVEADFTYSSLPLGNGAAVATGEAANAIVAEMLVKR
jgi:hypothetical protein